MITSLFKENRESKNREPSSISANFGSFETDRRKVARTLRYFPAEQILSVYQHHYSIKPNPREINNPTYGNN